MSIRLGSTVVNCADLDVMADFWGGLLGLALEELHDDFRILSGPAGSISLQRAATPVSGRDQMHLDLYATDKADQVARAVALGAQWVRHSGDPDDDYDVLRDPEGNEFCIVAHPA